MYHLVKVPEKKEKDMLFEFISTSAFTFEGIDLSKSNLKKVDKALSNNGYTLKDDDRVWYWFTGDVMNKHFGLTGDNAYSDDLNFLVIPNFFNPIFKMVTGARWFDDIVDQNRRRQSEMEV